MEDDGQHVYAYQCRTVPSECDDVIRRAAVSIKLSSRLPSRENTDGVLRTPSVFSSRFSVKNKKLIYAP